MNKLKICHIMQNSYGRNAAPYEYTQALSLIGHDVVCVCTGNVAHPGQVKLHKIDHGEPITTSVFQKIKFIIKVILFLNKNNYDLVHVYHFRFSFLLPLILNHHKNKLFIDIRTQNVCNARYKRFFKDKLTVLESLFYKNKIALDGNLGRKIFGKNTSFYILPLGVNLANFYPFESEINRKDIGLERSDIIFLTHGKLDSNRKQVNLIKAFERAVGINKNLKLIMIGDGDDLLNLKSYVSDNYLSKNILFLGLKKYEEIPSFINIADFGIAYIPINDHFQNQPPLKTAEYIGCGKPVVATGTNGNSLFVNINNGLLSSDDIDSFGNSILKMAASDYNSDVVKNSIKDFDYQNIVTNTLVTIYKAGLNG